MYIFFIVVTAYILILAMVAIGVVGFNPGAITPMFRAPRHFVQLLFNRQMRRNHALEHATINVIEQRYGRTSLVGMPDENGFHLRGRVSPDIITSASQEAVRRLQKGERDLAVVRRCPTALVSSQLGMAVIFIGVLLLVQQFSAATLLAVLVASALLGSPVSPYLQRFLLIDAKAEGLQVRDIEFEEPSGRLEWVSFLMLLPVFVRTASVQRRRGSNGYSDGDVTLITKDQEEIPAGGYRLRK